MREIKFKAFLKKVKRVLNVISIDFVNDGGFVEVNLYGDGGDYFYFKDIELMQYSGMKDVKGNEIYDGHILKTDNSFCEIWTVSYNGSSFVANQGNIDYFCSLDKFMESSSVEIIGTIYGNPELIPS